ncbi:MAG: hypothetical protein LBM75_01835 [Myxococcales bacterium]|jgi:hypothetical protein|nr:hypothetical protein [Myxococcales bacterium]
MRFAVSPCRPFAFVIIALLLCCGSGDITFSPEQDARALDRIAQTWSATFAQKAFSLSLCEDIATNAALTVDGCTYAHLVQSQGPAKETTIERANGGCENCFLGVFTNVIATFTRADGSVFQGKGIVSLGTAFDEDPYAGDYGLLLYEEGEDGNSTLVMEGRLQTDGTLILSGAALLNLGFEVTDAEVKLPEAAASMCGEQE